MNDEKFTPGQSVIYGANGVCKVDGVREMQLPYDDEAQSYYVLKPESKPGSTIYVPLGNEKLVARMRPLLDKSALDEVLQRVKGREMPWEEDRNTRHQAFNALMARRDQEEMLLMIRCIYARRRTLAKSGKRLPTVDDDILHNCERLLNQEFSLCLQIPTEEVGEYIRAALDND